MNTLETALLLLIAAAVGVVAAFVVAWLAPARNARLLRCPDTGAIAKVCTEEKWLPGRASPEVRVRWCDLWPLRKPCNRGCLKRYHETAPGHRASVEALRPFEHP